jgi:hypothetical protein
MPILVGLTSDADASGASSVIDLRVIDFMNHPSGRGGPCGRFVREGLPQAYTLVAGRVLP